MTWTKQPFIVEVLGSEDEETWFIQGHVDPLTAVLSVAAAHHYDYGPIDSAELLFGSQSAVGSFPTHADMAAHLAGALAAVRHVWLVGGDEECLLPPAAHTDPGAEPWTIWEVPR